MLANGGFAEAVADGGADASKGRDGTNDLLAADRIEGAQAGVKAGGQLLWFIPLAPFEDGDTGDGFKPPTGGQHKADAFAGVAADRVEEGLLGFGESRFESTRVIRVTPCRGRGVMLRVGNLGIG